MLVKTYGSALTGIEATTITIEVNMTKGANFFLVGLPDNAVKESQMRISAALKNTDYDFPVKRWTINMAPADLRKEGASFDLPIAIGILAASNQVSNEHLQKYIILGEMSLDGTLHPIKGALPIAIQAKKDGFEGIIIPKVNAEETSILKGINTYGVSNIREVTSILNDPSSTEPTEENKKAQTTKEKKECFSEVMGQMNIKRAFEIAAAGSHNIILIGPPGAGKSMLAKRLPSILPKMTLEETLETTKIHSITTSNSNGLVTKRPFRKPHHTISDVALVGGGTWPQPGEISLAHNGVLFLDELPEYKRTVLEVMRQPLEDRTISINRAKFSVDYPANFMLVAAMNPCPCGYYNHPTKDCTCSSQMVQRYLSKISGPLLDRIDLHIEVTPVDFDDLIDQTETGEPSTTIQARVEQTRKLQKDRYSKYNNIYSNSQITPDLIKKHCTLTNESKALIKTAMAKLNLSARAYDRIIKVARTIADLEQSENIDSKHIAEAIQYRSLDKAVWSN